MKTIEHGYPRLDKMASGGQYIAIAQCSYEEFAECSRFWAERLHARVLKKLIDGPDQRLLCIQIGAGQFWLAFDEQIGELNLEPEDAVAKEMIVSLYSVISQSPFAP